MSLITDLALILIVAGITTLIFKRLRQPLILGYILAGFLAGPHMPYMPSVHDEVSIHTWSEMGVIFIMFTLGLEFSFKKIVKMGVGPIIAAVSVIFFMISVGNLVGRAFGWSSMDSLFLGGMLAMSSTTVIYKALDELGLRQQKFAGVVLSVLILEDILGILLMVVLSAMAASHHLEGAELMGSLMKLGFFLILWFVVGLYVVPLFLRRNSKWIGRETLLVVSVGLCFLMVVLAEKAGYSSALGAFMMGSILAETTEAESVEKLVGPVRDLFGAVFFVSVGMLVDPAVLAQYWLPILVIVAAILLGQTVLGSFSFLISGQPLRVAMQCGFSLTQIGEFSFILASLGLSLKVTSGFLYPVVVAVSIITTFLTPYMMKAAAPACNALERMLPDRLTSRLAARGGKDAEEAPPHPWRQMGADLLVAVAAYGVLTIAALGVSLSTVLHFTRGLLGHWPGNAACGIVTLIVISLFLRPIVMKKMHSPEVKAWRDGGRTLHLLGFRLTVVLRYALATATVFYVIEFLSPFRWYYHLGVAALLVLLVCVERFGRRRNPVCKWVKYVSIRLERTFLHNLRSREIKARAHRPGYANTLRRHDVHLAQLALPDESAWGGQTLSQLDFGRKDNVMIAAVIRGNSRLNIPDGQTMLFPGDRIEVLGDDAGLNALAERMQGERLTLTPNDRKHRLSLEHFNVGGQSPLLGKTLMQSNIRNEYQCMVVGFESRDEEAAGSIELATADREIRAGDTLWVVGEEAHLKRLMEGVRGRVDE